MPAVHSDTCTGYGMYPAAQNLHTQVSLVPFALAQETTREIVIQETDKSNQIRVENRGWL